eukprot:g3061.t1
MPSILVGKYLLHTDVRLGSGGFGEVHAASLRGSVEVEDFAIKVGKRNNKKLVRRDQNELHILQSIKHPNIVELCDHFTADHGRLHLVMRRAAGDLTTMVTNFHSMRNFVNFSPNNQNEIHPNQFGAYEQWNCSLQICLGLEFLHNKNILHRDLKPENILFFRGAGSGEVDCAQAPQTHTVCGTHLYMAPEVLRGDRYFAAADMWSLGAVLYYVSFARVLFKTPAQVLLFQTAEHLEDWFPGRGCLVGDMGGRSKLKTVLAELALASTSASSNTSAGAVAINQNFSQKLIATAPAEVLEAYFSSTHASVRFWWSGAGNEVELECRPEARNAVLRNLPTIVAGCTRDLATCSRRLKHSGSSSRDHNDVLPFFLFRFLCIQRKEADASHLLDYATSANDLRLCLPVFAAAFGKQKTERLWAGLRSRFDWLSTWALKMADYGCRLEEVQENASGSNASGWSRRI